MLFLLVKCEFDGWFLPPKKELQQKIRLESVKTDEIANQDYINGKVFIGSLYDMKVLFNRSSEQKLYPKMIRQYAHLKLQYL